MERVLILAAHPDDEILGCGGFISKYIKIGCEFKIIFLGEGSSCRFDNYQSEQSNKEKKIRESCAIKAISYLGVKNYFFYDLPCGRFDQVPIIEINKIIEKEIDLYKPNTILTHSETDANNDHKIVYKSTIMSTRPSIKNNPLRVLSYEILSSSEWSFSNVFSPNYFEHLDQNELDSKCNAMDFYETEIKPFPFPRSREGIFTLAKTRGMQSGNEYAEAFKIIREIRK